jgi:NAD(P) transhydrogenase subunit beta
MPASTMTSFYMDQTMMLLGDAKKMADDIVKALNGGGH